MERYAMYLRKSRKDLELEQLGEGETLSRHLKILEDLCRKLKIVIADNDIYKEVVSGESIEARPQIKKLLNLVEQSYYTGVLVVEIERLARGDSIDQGRILKTFKLSKTKIVTPNKIYDFSKEIDEEYMEFGLFMSRREYKIISKRLLRGRNLSASEGKFVGSHAPYGYERIKIEHDKGYTLKINNDEANIVKLIFDMYANNLNKVPDICRYLNSLNILSPSKSKWTPDGIRRILKNPVYAGYIRYNKRVITTKFKDGKEYKTSCTNNGELKDLIFVKGLHEPIISKDLFNKALDIMKNNYISPSHSSLKNPLAGLIRCKSCGKILATSCSRGEKRLYCKTLDCNNKGHNLEQVEDKVLLFLENWLNDKELLYLNNSDSILQSKHALLNKLNEQLKKLKIKKEHIYDLFEDNIYDKDTFFERNNKISLSIDELESQITNLKNEIKGLENISVQKNMFIPNLQKVLKEYRLTSNTEQKNFLLKSVIDKIYFLKNETGNRWHKANFELWILPKIPKN